VESVQLRSSFKMGVGVWGECISQTTKGSNKRNGGGKKRVEDDAVTGRGCGKTRRFLEDTKLILEMRRGEKRGGDGKLRERN